MALIPLVNLVPRTPGVHVGLVGGIPTNRTNLIDATQAPYNADPTGGTETSGAIMAAVAAAIADGTKHGVLLPEIDGSTPGVYRIDAGLLLQASFSGKSLVGSGMGRTILDQRSNTGIYVDSFFGQSYPNYPVVTRVTDGLAKGSVTVEIDGDTDDITVGQIVLFGVKGDPNLPVADVYRYDVETDSARTTQLVRVVSKTADTITFFPPLFHDYGGGAREVRVYHFPQQLNGIGIEDLTIDAENYTTGGGAYSNINVGNAYGFFLKNCDLRNALHYGIVLQGLNFEIRHSWIGNLKGSGTNGAGLLLVGGSGLVEDNVFEDAFPLLEMNGGSSGNVFTYNFGVAGGMWNVNHGAHNQFNYHEGNAVGYYMDDGYFGSSAYNTQYRNLYHGLYGVNLKRWTRYEVIVGNITPVQHELGYPGIGTGTLHEGTAQLSIGDPWRDWDMLGQLVERTDDNNGVITLSSGKLFAGAGTVQVIRLIWGAGNDLAVGATVESVVGNDATILTAGVLPPINTVVKIGPGSYYDSVNGSFFERDLDVPATTTSKGNFFTGTNTLEELGADPLVDSIIHDSKPSWWDDDFGVMDWPPFDPANSDTHRIDRIPAGRRWLAAQPLSAPVFTSDVSISGSPMEGELLNALGGNATGNPLPDYTYQWKRDGVDIVGATASTYLLVSGDVGTVISVEKEATNTEGTDTSTDLTEEVLPYMGDILIYDQTTNTDPVTEIWRRAVVVNGVAGDFEDVIINHSGDYPNAWGDVVDTLKVRLPNNFVYAAHGSLDAPYYVFPGTLTLNEAQFSREHAVAP